MKRRFVRRTAGAAAMLTGGILLQSAGGCLPEGTMANIASNAASSVARSLVDLIVINTLENAFDGPDAAQQ